MSYSQQDFYDQVLLHLGTQLEELLDPASVYRWINDGKNRLGARQGKTTTMTWAQGDHTVPLPSDLRRVDGFVPYQETAMPEHRIFGRNLRFTDPGGAPSAGSAYLDYWAYYEDVGELTEVDLQDRRLFGEVGIALDFVHEVSASPLVLPRPELHVRS